MKNFHQEVVAICDGERRYACRLMEYLQDSRVLSVPVNVFTSAKKLTDLARPEDVSLLVISESEYFDVADDTRYDHVLVLSESGRKLPGEVQCVGKYQPMEQITDVIVAMLTKENTDSTSQAFHKIRLGTPMKRIGFYTPVTRCLQTTTALCLSQLLARQKKTLYMNFEEIPGLSELIGEGRGSVTDLLYYNDCAKNKVAMQLQRRIRNLGGADVIPPCGSFEELHSITGEQWTAFLETINQVSDYEYLVMDFGSGCGGLLDLLETCEVVYTITGNDAISQGRVQAFDTYLQQQGREGIISRTRKLALPYFDGLPHDLSDMTRSDLCDWIQTNILMGQG